VNDPGERTRVVLGFGLLGRAVDGGGAPLDGRPLPRGRRRPLRLEVPAPRDRPPASRPLVTGLRSIDGLLTIARGARVGIFGPAGTGKTTLLESIASAAWADAVVVALIGERGREAGAWIARARGRLGIVCATGDRPAAERIRAAELAFAQAAALRRGGLDVLLILDSLARCAHALRDVRLERGEPPGRAGFPPGVFADLARLLESAGPSGCGSITLLATVLCERDGDDHLAEAARSMLDGHLVLSPERAARGAFPSIDVPASASRTMRAVVSDAHARSSATVRAALALLADTADARRFGLAGGSEPKGALARAVAAEPALEAFLRQDGPVAYGETVAALDALAQRIG
jgi:type III secretion protein N (ATPase)